MAATFNTSKFKTATRSSNDMSNVWQQVLAMIQAMIAGGSGKAAIEAEVDALIMATALPAWLKPLVVGMANVVIDTFLAQAGVQTAKP